MDFSAANDDNVASFILVAVISQFCVRLASSVQIFVELGDDHRLSYFIIIGILLQVQRTCLATRSAKTMRSAFRSLAPGGGENFLDVIPSFDNL